MTKTEINALERRRQESRRRPCMEQNCPSPVRIRAKCAVCGSEPRRPGAPWAPMHPASLRQHIEALGLAQPTTERAILADEG